MYPDASAIPRKLAELRSEHRDLDHAISHLQADIATGELSIKRMK